MKTLEIQPVSTAPQMKLLRMTDGLILHQSLYVAAKLGIADLLTDNVRSSSEIAAALDINQDALYRVLRFLAGYGVRRRRSL